MITIVDIKAGNLGSITNMLSRIGVASRITTDPSEIAKSTKLILPGVGAFNMGMENLSSLDVIPALTEAVRERQVPVLGICVGMQIMSEYGEEGDAEGLGWIRAKCVRFKFDQSSPRGLKIPHMGWEYVHCQKPDVLPFDTEAQRYYFVHSYHVRCDDSADVWMSADYGGQFTAAVAKGNILGVQFHPEKSHKYGLSLLKAFAEWVPGSVL